MTTTNGSSAQATKGTQCWRVEGLEDAHAIPSADMDVVIKCVEGSTDREEEILFVDRGSDAASLDFVRNASASDPWQWQRRVRGEDFSARYLAVDGRVAFSTSASRTSCTSMACRCPTTSPPTSPDSSRA